MSMMYIRILVGLHLKYYTDRHDVDEDMRTIMYQGGRWLNNTSAGITYQDTDHTSTDSFDSIASNAKI